ncbi:filamentous hemagglutinin N-terminal domain-containing protein [Nostoc sp. FACHB-152]|uniref:two-partner secretion domain-containing protein n=1 Tax=unclassified Nostoc TaxID=2593658 RepID=UPI0016821479|nr:MULTISPECIES: filamentous hemagglutinin N-terminal domain-containing protein [unclassified Nostoc]MBD2446490.1 filamentous hemagglutinin N-terminal domain-containing protein [Nostoc sp. FACHB-152]MBD2468713.1 filamentous hemagglutinin N-terminal domain-containing protein [Nostoc sp. FACHB-145]
MKHLLHQIFITSSVYLCCLITGLPAAAQISSDNTLGSNVNQSGNSFEVTGGRQVGSNLFHSFQQFSVPTGGEAFFNNTSNLSNITNIINRVTGGSTSNIDGLIRENYGANFILINPSGINFGANAQLNIGGSFLGSTANSLRFADGAEFSATDTSISPQLTISVPVGLQFGQNPQAIRLQGQGHNLSRQSSISSPFTRGNTTGLKVQPGNTLALVGGGIISEGGTLTAEDGRIDLGSVAGGLVSLNPNSQGWNLSYQGVTDFQDITLSQKALADTSGIGSGSIGLQGRNISLRDGSVALIQTQGAQAASGIHVNAAESLALVGTTADGQISSNISTETIGSGKSGDINVSTSRLVLQNGGAISAKTYSNAPGGNIDIKATDTVQMSGFSAFNPRRFSNITAGAYGGGAGGNLAIATGNLTIGDRAFISSETFGSGTGGNVNIQAANSVDISGTGFEELQQTFQIGALLNLLQPTDRGTGIFLGTAGAGGTSGNLNLETSSLIMRNGGIIFSPTFIQGIGGNLNIRASEVLEMSGSAIQAGNSRGSNGTGGNIAIDTKHLNLQDGSVIISATFGNGKGGDVNVKADTISIQETPLGAALLTGIYTNTTIGQGQGGHLNIDTGNLLIKDGVIASNTGASLPTGVIPFGGPGGNVTINARDTVEIAGVLPDPRFPSGLGTTAFSQSTAGDLTVFTKKLILREGADASTATLGAGQGGTLTVNASESVELSGITVGNLTLGGLSAAAGRANLPELKATGASGDIKVFTDKLIVRDGARIDVESLGTGNAGNLQVVANSIFLDNQGSISAATTSGEGGNISIHANSLLMRHTSQISATAGGSGNGGNINITGFSPADFVTLLEGSKITADAVAGRGGNININARGFFLCPTCVVSASSQLGIAGQVSIITPEAENNFEVLDLPQEVAKPEQVVAQACRSENRQAQSEFTITGRGGLPPRPSEQLSSGALINFEPAVANSAIKGQNSSQLPPAARGWYVNAKGVVVLASQTPTPSPYSSELTSSNCHVN